MPADTDLVFELALLLQPLTSTAALDEHQREVVAAAARRLDALERRCKHLSEALEARDAEIAVWRQRVTA